MAANLVLANNIFSNAKYMEHAETKKAIVANLKAKFPGVKFKLTKSSVGSITVRWEDGPSHKAVNESVGFIENKGFDGMIDMTYHHYHYFDVKTGTLRYAGTHGTGGSRGSVPEVYHEINPGELVVHVSNSYMNVERSYSVGFLRDVIAPYMKKRYGRELGRDFVISTSQYDPTLNFMEPAFKFYDNNSLYRDIESELRDASLEVSA